MSQQSMSPAQPGSDTRPSMYARLLAFVVRPTAPPLWLGIVVAAAFITAETLLVYRLKQLAPENAFGALFLLGVLVVSAGWGFRLAIATSLMSALVYVYFHLETEGIVPRHPQDWVAILIFLPVALLANVLAGQARLRGRVRTAQARSRGQPRRRACPRRAAGRAAARRDDGGARRRSVRGVSGGGGRTVSRTRHRQRGPLAVRDRPSASDAGDPRRAGFDSTAHRRTAFARG